MMMQYHGSPVESGSVARPKGLLGALDEVEVCHPLVLLLLLPNSAVRIFEISNRIE